MKRLYEILICACIAAIPALLVVSILVDCKKDKPDNSLLMHTIDFGSMKGTQEFYCINGKVWTTHEREVNEIIRKELVPFDGGLACEEFMKSLRRDDNAN